MHFERMPASAYDAAPPPIWDCGGNPDACDCPFAVIQTDTAQNTHIFIPGANKSMCGRGLPNGVDIIAVTDYRLAGIIAHGNICLNCGQALIALAGAGGRSDW